MESSLEGLVLDVQTQAMNFSPAPKYHTWNDYVARKIVKSPWEQWFAWYPVKVNGNRIWLKTVYRRCINTYVDMDNWKRYEYGNVFDILKD